VSLTFTGWAGLGAFLLTVMSAVSTGNNLLYLLLSLELSAYVISVFGRWNVERVAAEFEFPGQIFRGSEFQLRVILRNAGLAPSFALRARWGAGAAAVSSLETGGSREVVLRCCLPHRGLNRLEGLFLESSFPFGLIRHSRDIGPAQALAYPALREIRAASEISQDIEVTGRTVMRRGRGDELYGVREKDPSDDARMINWKLTARAGRPLVNEYAGAEGSKITVKVDGARGPNAEARIAEAASAVRYHVDGGAEVRLITPEGQTDYGRGLLHLDRCLEHLARLGDGGEAREALAFGRPVEAPVDTPAVRRLLYVGGLLLAASLFLIDEIDLRLAWLVLGIVPVGWLWHEFEIPRLPSWLWEGVSGLFLLYLLAFDWRASGVAIANTHLVAYLVANRALVGLKSTELRQVFLIVFLGFFLVSGLSISPWYFACFVGFLLFSSRYLMLDAGLEWDEPRRWAPSWLGLSVAALAVTAGFFLVTPRVDRFRRLNPFVAMGIDKLQVQNSAVAGYTEDISLGFYGNLKKSTAKVMRVTPIPSTREHPGPLKIRGAAYDRFDGRRWSRTKPDFRYSYGDRGYWTAQARAWVRREGSQLVFPARPGPKVYDFMIYPMNQTALFSVGSPATVELSHEAAYFDLNDGVSFSVAYMAGAHYRVRPAEALGYAASVEGYQALLGPRYLQLPDADPKRRDLARKIAASAKTPEEKAAAVEAYLRKNYAYSTYSALRDKSLDDFLFSKKDGNCEYFATAAAVLLRELGVPSRLATGFLADDWNEFGRFYDVRQGQAHAWTEAWLPGQGWVTLEPTPGQGLFGSEALTRRLQRWFEALEGRWYRHVIGYDQYVQRNTFFRLGRALSRETMAGFLKLIVGGALAGGLLYGLLTLRPWAGERRKGSGLFHDVERACAKLGVKRLPHQTPREFARAHAHVAGLSDLAELHYLDRYRGPGLTPRERARARELIAGLRPR
jgi:uncharacterized protein (DUF58 family)/transglutaminase-like putative cysteine protease